RTSQVDGLGVDAHAEIERQRRRALPRLEGTRERRRLTARPRREADHCCRCHEDDKRYESDDTSPRRHAAECSREHRVGALRSSHYCLPGRPWEIEPQVAIFGKVMPTYRELLAKTKAQIDD